MYDILESKLQLHQRLEILYVVDGYQAIFTTTNGDREVARGKGKSIEEAIAILETKIVDFDIRNR